MTAASSSRDVPGPAGEAGEVIVRRKARGLLLHQGRLALINRIRPGRAPYCVTPGGRAEDTDTSVESALRREVREELGGTIGPAVQVLLLTDQLGVCDDGVHLLGVQHIFVAPLLTYDLSARSGPEFTGPDRADCGTYDLLLAPLDARALTAVNLKPPQLADYVMSNLAALAAETGSHHAAGPGEAPK